MLIHTTSFVKSSTSNSQLPPPDRPEYAFIGRSNVGKSSLINMLALNGKLAKTSATPGKTQLINHFLINDTWYLVDLPGYGYAKTGKQIRKTFAPMILNYLGKRENLLNIFLLIDIRHEPQKLDIRFIELLAEAGVAFSLVFTKTDKLSNRQLNIQLDSYKQFLAQSWEELPPLFVTSSETRLGREEILNYIEYCNARFVSPIPGQTPEIL